jgi:hypothetical protein
MTPRGPARGAAQSGIASQRAGRHVRGVFLASALGAKPVAADPGGLPVQVPLKISFHNMDSSEGIEARVRERVARLERVSHEIVSCRVSIEAPHKQPHRSTVGITIDIAVPG